MTHAQRHRLTSCSSIHRCILHSVRLQIINWFIGKVFPQTIEEITLREEPFLYLLTLNRLNYCKKWRGQGVIIIYSYADWRDAHGFRLSSWPHHFHADP